ncbi:hypothetical protein SANTM175S_02718 [Streptomyces antimycoticus]
MMKPTGKNVDPQDRAFGQRVQKYRKERRRTQAELAGRAREDQQLDVAG